MGRAQHMWTHSEHCAKACCFRAHVPLFCPCPRVSGWWGVRCPHPCFHTMRCPASEHIEFPGAGSEFPGWALGVQREVGPQANWHRTPVAGGRGAPESHSCRRSSGNKSRCPCCHRHTRVRSLWPLLLPISGPRFISPMGPGHVPSPSFREGWKSANWAFSAPLT